MISTTLVLAAYAALATAQSLSDLPQCGQTCINNMIGIAQSSFGCPNNATCFCCKPEFGFGIRDCTNESCPSDAAPSVISYAGSYCASALPSAQVSVCSSFASGTGSGSTSASVTGTSASGPVTPISGGAAGYAVANTTITAGGPDVSSGGTDYSALPSGAGVLAVANGASTTLAGSGSGSGSGASGSMPASSGASASMTTKPASASASSSSTSGSSGSSTAAAGGAGSSSSSSGAAAFQTVGPALIGAAAIALVAL